MYYVFIIIEFVIVSFIATFLVSMSFFISKNMANNNSNRIQTKQTPTEVINSGGRGGGRVGGNRDKKDRQSYRTTVNYRHRQLNNNLNAKFNNMMYHIESGKDVEERGCEVKKKITGVITKKIKYDDDSTRGSLDIKNESPILESTGSNYYVTLMKQKKVKSVSQYELN